MGAGRKGAKLAARGAVAGTPLAFRAVRWCFRALVSFGAMVASTRWGRVSAVAVVVLMLVDASWGSDGVGFPVIGWIPALVLMLVAGGLYGRRDRRHRDRIEEAVRTHVPGYYRSDEVRVRYGIPVLGNVQPLQSFSSPLPTAMTGAEIESVETRLRSVLPAASGSTWQFAWDTSAGHLRAWLIPDLPRSVWHPYASGAHGNPLAPIGDPDVIPLGVSYGDERLAWRVNDAPHALIVGGTGGGKSVLINTIIEHLLLYRDRWQMYMIDLKTTEFAEFAEYPGVAQKVALSHEEALEVLQAAQGEMQYRQYLLREGKVKDLPALNAQRRSRGESALPRIIVVMDEIGELLAATKDKDRREIRDECEEIMLSIGRLGRAMGVHLLTATQRTSKDLMPMELRLNTALRVGLGKLDPYQSEMVLGSAAGQAVSGGKGRGVLCDNSREQSQQVKHMQAYRIEMAHIRQMIGVAPEDSED